MSIQIQRHTSAQMSEIADVRTKACQQSAPECIQPSKYRVLGKARSKGERDGKAGGEYVTSASELEDGSSFPRVWAKPLLQQTGLQAGNLRSGLDTPLAF